jgi:hypothetical protein
MDENGRKTSQPFSTFTFEYENESESGKAGHGNKHELTEYREFRKRINSSEIMSNTVGIQKNQYGILTRKTKCTTMNK